MENDTQAEYEQIDETGTQEAPPEETQETQVEEKKEHEPGIDSPRWKELYWQKKEGEREIGHLQGKIQEQSDAIQAIQQHNQALMDAMSGFENRFDDLSKPDREVDPDGYEKWLINKAKREAVQEQRQVKPKEEPPQQPQQPKGKVDMREVEFAGSVNDYYEIVNPLVKELQENPSLSAQVWNSTNPFEAAYKYGKAKQRRASAQKQAIVDQGFVEGDSKKTVDQKPTLTKEEKYQARMLGVTEEAYARQKAYIEGRH